MIHLLLLISGIRANEFTAEKFMNAEARIIEKILAIYNTDVRPSLNGSGAPIEVNIAVTLMMVLEVDEKEEQMVTTAYTTQSWHDSRLTWDPTQYENCSEVRLKPSDIWKPNIIMFNSDDGDFKSYIQETNIVMLSTGDVSWLPPALFRSSCTMDVSLFPFDRQNCTLVFSSSTYDARDLLFTSPGQMIIDAGFTENSEWQLDGCPGQLSTRHTENGDTFHEVLFTLYLTRLPLFYVLNIIIPIILMFLLSVGVFYLPVDSGEKMTLSISILLGQTVFLFLVAQIMPETSISVPLIAKYLLFTMSMVALSVILSVVVSNIHYRSTSTHVLPAWMKKFFIMKVAPMIGVRRPNVSNIVLPTDNSRRKGQGESDQVFDQSKSENDPLISRGERQPTSHKAKPLARELKPAIEAIHFITEKLRLEDQAETVEDDWQYIAMICDRVLLLLYSIAGMIGTLVIFQKVWESKPWSGDACY